MGLNLQGTIIERSPRRVGEPSHGILFKRVEDARIGSNIRVTITRINFFVPKTTQQARIDANFQSDGLIETDQQFNGIIDTYKNPGQSSEEFAIINIPQDTLNKINKFLQDLKSPHDITGVSVDFSTRRSTSADFYDK